jgi:hypothetical protein
MNSNTVNSSGKLPHGVNWMQYDEAVDGSGNVYGSIQYWPTSGSNLFNSVSNAMDTITYVLSGDYFSTILNTNSGPNVTSATFFYYSTFAFQLYNITVNVPSSYIVPVVAYRVNIVGENSGHDPNADFSSGAGTVTYSSANTNGVVYNTSLYSCTSGHGSHGTIVVTGETANINWATPTQVGTEVTQTFTHS